MVTIFGNGKGDSCSKHGRDSFIPLGKVWFHLFFLQPLVNSWEDWAFKPSYGILSRRKALLYFFPCIESCSCRGVGKYTIVRGRDRRRYFLDWIHRYNILIWSEVFCWNYTYSDIIGNDEDYYNNVNTYHNL